MTSSRLLWRLRSGFTAPAVLVGLGFLLALISALDLFRTSGRIVGPLLAAVGLALARWREGVWPRPIVVSTTLTLVLAVGASSRPQFQRADFPQYFCYLRSMAFDHDLDFANEWAHWGFDEEPVTPTGHRRIQGSIGPALFWSPAYVVAHLYVVADRVLGSGRWEANGYEGPYARATLVGTLSAAVLGSFALGSVIAARLSGRVAVLAIAGAVATSPVLFYLFIQPGMAHGLTYALAALGMAAADRLHRAPSLGGWAIAGAIVGLLALVRPQAAAFGLLLVPIALDALRRKRLKPQWLLAAAGGAFVGFLPQMLAWKVIYGHWLTQSRELEEWAEQAGVKQRVLFRMSSWFDPRALHLVDTLFAADRGLFSWTPLALLGVAGLPFAARRFGPLALGGLLVFAATAWFNGSVATYRAGDSFGARRYDVVIPFLALSFAVGLEVCRRRPLVAPALLLGLAALWNVGLIRLWMKNDFPGAAPLERLATAQAEQVEDLSEQALGAAFGPGGRAFAYKALVGEYMYFNLGEDGVFDMSRPTLSYLTTGWSPAVNRTGPPQFRTAFHPEACLRFPLMVGVATRVTVTAKTPGRLAEQRLGLRLNGHRHEPMPLGQDFSDVVFELPRAEALAGENTLCLEFTAGASKRDEGERIAAHVRRVMVESKTPSWPSPVWGLRGVTD